MSGVEGSGRAEARFSTLLLNLGLKRRSTDPFTMNGCSSSFRPRLR
jgi:hypothetical protein